MGTALLRKAAEERSTVSLGKGTAMSGLATHCTAVEWRRFAMCRKDMHWVRLQTVDGGSENCGAMQRKGNAPQCGAKESRSSARICGGMAKHRKATERLDMN